MTGQALLFVLVGFMGFYFRSTFHLPGSGIAGFVLLAGGGLVGLAGVLAIGRGLTPFPKPALGTRLVTTGIYRFIRHPLYLAVLLGASGWGFVRESWPALASALALGVFLNAKAGHEERYLLLQFPDYRAYAVRVRRFIPGVW